MSPSSLKSPLSATGYGFCFTLVKVELWATCSFLPSYKITKLCLYVHVLAQDKISTSTFTVHDSGNSFLVSRRLSAQWKSNIIKRSDKNTERWGDLSLTLTSQMSTFSENSRFDIFAMFLHMTKLVTQSECDFMSKVVLLNQHGLRKLLCP